MTGLLLTPVLLLGAEPLPRVAPLAEVRSPAGALESVCHLHTQRTRLLLFSGDYNSSGVLYRGRYVITAAHNVYSPVLSRLRSLAVACGVTEPARSQHQQVSLSDVRVASSYGWMPRRFDRDFAVIRLPQAFPVGTPFQLSPMARGQGQLIVHLAGFPGSGPDARMNGERMFAAAGVGEVDESRPFLHYSIQTYVGNSGGPVWRVENSRPLLAGIHISGGPLRGRARLADAAFVAQVEAIISEMDNGN